MQFLGQLPSILFIRVAGADPASIEKEKMLTTPEEMPHSTHMVLPVLQPRVENDATTPAVPPLRPGT